MIGFLLINKQLVSSYLPFGDSGNDFQQNDKRRHVEIAVFQFFSSDMTFSDWKEKTCKLAC